jgi:hypothetical protein
MAKQKAGHTPAPVVEPELGELEPTRTDGGQIQAFVEGAKAFFLTARALEAEALETLADVKARTTPATMQEDETIQRIVKLASAQKKGILGHWQITSLVSQFHKRLVAKRKVGEDAADQAALIGNRLHSEWVSAEARRVRAENERREREAEERARQEREAELARLEAEAVKAEESSATLSERERYFVDLVFQGFNTPATSARMAGFKSPEAAAGRLMSSAKILAAIEAKRASVAIRQKAQAVKALPLEVEHVEEDRPQVSKAVGHDRTTRSAELVNEQALIDAIVRGGLGIPTDVLTINRPKLNEYARSLDKLINRWPGVRLVTKTGVV